MKKFIIMLCVLLLCAPVALAEDMSSAQAYDWDTLGTIAGATAWTVLLVQFIKAPLDKVWKIPTRIVVYVIALATMVLAHMFAGAYSWQAAGLDAVNAVIVAMAAMGTYEMTYKREEAG